MNPSESLWLVLVLPLAGALLVAISGRWPNLREAITLATASSLFVVVWMLAYNVESWTMTRCRLFTLSPGLEFALQVEALGILFALVASFLWIVTSVYAIGYMRGYNNGKGEKHQTRFYVAFAVAIAAAMGVAFSANMLTLFICYEILTLSTYPLVTHAGTEEARRGGRMYLGVLLGTSIGLQFLAIIGTWLVAGTLEFSPGGILSGKASDGVIALLLVLYILGIGKAALMPFHRWLPAAMVAPTPVSALLHAVAVVKAGVFTVLKVVAFVIGTDFFVADSDAAAGAMRGLVSWVSQGLIYLAIASLLLASILALRQDNLKRRLAYSTVSQLAYIVLGALLGHSLGLLGGAMHIATHAFGKITLFFAAGAILVASHKTEISDMRGLGRCMPVTFACFFLASLSLIGLPFFGGFWSKWYLAYGAVQTGQWLALTALMVSSLLSIAYLLPVSVQAFFSDTVNTTKGWTLKQEAPWPCLVAMVIAVLGCFLLFFMPENLYRIAMMFSTIAVEGGRTP